jgi:1-deoxy-D-xylulose-5-phosphate reductoisomerase
VLADAAAAERLDAAVRAHGLATQVRHGPAALEEIARGEDVDLVMAAIVGAAGLPATLAAAKAGKEVLLANKEALVMSGALFIAAAAEGGATLLPIDSEHSAVFQSLPRGFVCGRAGEFERSGARRILLTASGGPFRTTPIDRLARVTPQQAVAHPNWVMGPKISVDSATMMNKGLEVIEARWLFDLEPQRIEVVIHPQSIVHSMVEYIDGSVIAQLSNPDMRVPIAHALAYPERIASGARPLDLAAMQSLSFERPDHARFPCLPLAYEALRAGGTAPAALNAANEVAVAAFLGGRLPFLGIPAVISDTLDELGSEPVRAFESLYEADRAARGEAAALVEADADGARRAGSRAPG